MSSVIPFSFESHNVRVVTDDTGTPWFNAADVCAALELANPRDAVAKHVDEDDVEKRDAIDSIGRVQQVNHINESGLYALIMGSTKESAKRFKKWVTSEVLPSIRKTGSYTAPNAAKIDAVEASTTFNALHSVAMTLGLDRNAASISANTATRALTGANLLELLGQTNLLSPDQNHRIMTPTQIGAELGGMTGQAVNQLLVKLGFQVKTSSGWQPTEKAINAGYQRMIDSSKRHSDGSMVQQLKWSSAIIKELQ